jgi:hypothetical protein
MFQLELSLIGMNIVTVLKGARTLGLYRTTPVHLVNLKCIAASFFGVARKIIIITFTW